MQNAKLHLVFVVPMQNQQKNCQGKIFFFWKGDQKILLMAHLLDRVTQDFVNGKYSWQCDQKFVNDTSSWLGDPRFC